MVNGLNIFKLADPVAQLVDGSVLAFVQLAALQDNGSFEDELAAGEALANAAQDTGFTILGLPWWGFVLLLVLIIGVLWMLGMIARSLKQNQETDDELIENPLFEEQFAVHDDEAELTADLENDLAEIMIDESDVDNIGVDTEDEPDFTPRSLFDSEEEETGETEIEAEAEETADAYEEEPEETVEYEEEALSEEEELAAAYDDTLQSDENVIRFTGLVEEPEEEEAGELVAESADEAPYMADEPVYEEAVAEEEPAAQFVQEETPDDQVRYAYASSIKGPIAFSNITDGEQHGTSDEEAPVASEPSARPYIAPTVLRDDMVKLERQQAEHMDAVKNELLGQISSMKSEHNSRLDLIINSLDRKIEHLAESTRQSQESSLQPLASATPELTRQVNNLQAMLENQGQRIRAITQILDDRLGTVGHVYGEVRAVGERLENLGNKFDKLEKSVGERSQHDVIADVQLSDVVRSSLSPDQYEFKPLLSNNNRADCLIRLPHPPGAIVVDTRFPLDAFNALPPRDEVAQGQPQAKAAEDSFRRSVLRHIIDVAERFIIPGETADSALLFLPTEAIYTTLHARFPDLVRDSFRARVWIVSPATLMGTLQTLRGVLRDAREHSEAREMQRETREVMSEVEALREQASTLARNFETTQNELRSLLEATGKVTARRVPQPGQDRDALMSQLYDNRPEWPGTPADEKAEESSRSGGLFEERKTPPDNLR
jgi:DNA recombination protein RmuC